MQDCIGNIRKQIDNNHDIPNVKVLKVLQKRKRQYEQWNNDEREQFIKLVKEHGNNPTLISMHLGTKEVRSVYDRCYRLVKMIEKDPTLPEAELLETLKSRSINNKHWTELENQKLLEAYTFWGWDDSAIS